MDLTAYFSRIAYSGTPRVDLATLNALHEAHVRAVPFENLDVFAGRRVTYSLEAAFDEIVTRKQGGWCFEMNTLFEWVLREIGFEVHRICGGVRRWQRGDAALGNHLALLVQLDQDYLVDVGFGSWQMYAMPLTEEVTRHRPIEMALSRPGNGYWRLHEGGPGAAHSYDFKTDDCDEALLTRMHDELATGEDSIFRRTLLAMRREGRDIYMLRGRVLTRLRPGGKNTETLESADDLGRVLENVFELSEPDLNTLWPKICARHERQFPHASGRIN